jgi:beta-lactam-binding protein with PASTA domain
MEAEYSRAARVTVPLLTAMTVQEARSVGHKSGVVVTSADVDGPPLGARTWPGVWIVTAQRPAAGSLVPRGSAVVIEWAKLRNE